MLFSINGNSQILTQYFDGADTSIYDAILVQIDSGSVWQIGPPSKPNYIQSASTVPNAIVTDTINPYPINNTSRFEINILNEWAISNSFIEKHRGYRSVYA